MLRVLLWGLTLLWVGYAAAGRRWRVAPCLAAARPDLCAGLVVAVVPARDEAGELPRTLPLLLGQTYPRLRVVLVDDHSRDGTPEVARDLAATLHASDRLQVVSAPELPVGWTGKVWAQQQGIERARELGADWVWLTDADIAHDTDVLERLLTTVAQERRDFVSVMARLRCSTRFEKLLIPAFTYFFAALYAFRRIADDTTRLAGAAGGCMMVRWALLERIGGMRAIRGAVIDDVSLARVCKAAGGRLWLGFHVGINSTRGYATLRGIWDMVARSAYTQLGYNPAALVGCVLGLALVFLLPIWAALCGHGVGRVLGLLAYAGMVRTYLPMVSYLGCAWGWALALPLSAALYAAMTVSSAWRHHFGGGAAWKGRAYGKGGPA